VGKKRSALAVGREMPPNIDIVVQCKTDLRKAGCVAVRVKDMPVVPKGGC